MSKFKPMLAGKAPTLDRVRYPVLVSPKLDGVRALVIDGVVVSRNLLPIPNPLVQDYFGHPRFNGLDGELIVGEPTAADVYRRTQSLTSSHDVPGKVPPLAFHVFDDFENLYLGYDFALRFRKLQSRVSKTSKVIKVVPHLQAVNHHAIELYEEEFVKSGFEGAMLRDPHGPYKFGRSTTNEGFLLKLKRFEDDEAVIVGFKELGRNENVERTGGLAQRRSSKKAGRVAAGTLGALHVRRSDGVEFDVGSGFDQAERARLWERRDALVGLVVKYRFFPGGSKEKPRFPTFQGFRDKFDL